MSSLSLGYASSLSLKRDASIPKISKALPYLAAALTNLIQGSGAPIGSFGQASMNPALFAMIRIGVSAPILIMLSCYGQKTRVSLKEDWRTFAISGFCLSVALLSWLTGIKLANSVEASIWQVMCGAVSLMYGYCLGVEQVNLYKILGILVSIGGALFMVLYSQSNSGESVSFWQQFGGSICFFMNVSFISFYFISLKKWAVTKYTSTQVVAYSWLFAAIFTTIATILFSLSDELMALLCDDCTAWTVPSLDNYLALLYYIVILSVLCYIVMIWSTKYVSPAMVLVFTVLQPVSSCGLNQVLLWCNVLPMCGEHLNPNHGDICVYGLSMSDLGVFPIILGLYLVVYGNEKIETGHETDKLADDMAAIQSYDSINDQKV